MNTPLTLWLASAALLAGQAIPWCLGLLRLLRMRASAAGEREHVPLANPGEPCWILVAARDEVAQLPALAQALLPQLGESCSLLLVDDGSRDGTAARARELFSSSPHVQVLERPAEGKSAALAAGLDWILTHSMDHTVVLFTDADCRPGPGWVAAHRTAQATGAQLVCGHVVLETEGGSEAQQRFRRFESAVSSLQCALGCALGSPGYARGGNWSTRVDLLKRAGARTALAGLPSGDDVHLVRRLLKVGAQPRFLLEPDSRVWTRESARPVDLERQARRRYGKLRELSWGERTRQAGLFAALLLQLALLLHGLLSASPWSVLPLALLGLLLLAARVTLSQGLRLLGEFELAERPLASALALIGHALRHSVWGSVRGYSWRSASPQFPDAREQERKE